MSQRITLSLAACCLSLSTVAAGQTRATTADLGGTIVDQSSAVLPGATVTAQNVDTNQARSAMTDERGHFLIPALPPGTYDVRAELQGFAPRTLEDVVLTLGSLLDVRLSLNVAGGQEIVLVAGDAPVIDPQRTVVSSVISQEQIRHLPINGRNFIGFSLLAPGVATDRTPQQGASGTSGLSFAGQRARSNNITVDGLDNNDSTIGSVRATFSQEAVREFQVLTNSFSAEFGKASGGVVNIVTKSGTNTTAGNLFFFLRDGALNSKDHFERFNPAGQAIDREKAPYSQKQYGATLGGPLKRDRTFYFLSFERLDIAAHNFVTIDDTNNVTFLGQNYGTPAAILRRAGFEIETGHVPYDIRSNQLLGKIDHQLNSSNSLTGRINWANDINENIEPFGGNVARSRGAVLESEDMMFALSHMWVGSAKFVNEIRFLSANRDQTVNSLDPKCGGVCTLENQGGPTLEVLGVASVGRQRFTPQPRKNQRFQVLDTVSYFTGPHQFKAGFDYNYIDAGSQSLPLHFGGRYIFGSIPAASAPLFGLPAVEVPAIVAVQLGLPGRYVQGYGDSATPYTYSDFSLFAQDDWRITPRLTAKIGVRYQVQLWPDISYNVTGYPSPYTFPGDGNNVAPRLGLVWDPIGDRKTTIHGAYGLYYDSLITGIAGITKGINGRDRVRTLVASLPTTITAWNAPGRKLPEPSSAYPSLVISIDPGARDAVRASSRGWHAARAPRQHRACRRCHLRARLQAAVNARLQSTRPVARCQQAPLRPERCRRNICVGAPVHVVRRDLVSRRHGRGVAPIHRSPSALDQLHAVEGRGQRHRLPERVHRAGQRPRSQSERPERVTSRVRSGLRKRRRPCRINGTGSSRAVSTCCRKTSSCRRSSRWALGGHTTFLRVSISTRMGTAARRTARDRRSPILPRLCGATRARCPRRRPSMSGWRGDSEWDAPASTASSRSSTSSIARTTPR